MLDILNWLVSLIVSLYPVLGYQASVSPVRDPVFNPLVSPIIPAPTARPFWGLSFDGGDYLIMTNAVSAGAFDFGTDSFGISMWIYATLVGEQFVFDKRMGEVIITVRQTGSTPRFYIKDGTNYLLWGAGTVSANTWTHLVFVVDRVAQLSYIYKNGVSQGTPPSTAAIGSLTNTGPAQISNIASGAFFFSGRLASFRVWKGTALTGPQVLAEYNNTRPYYSPGPQPTYAAAFQPGSGQTVSPYIGIPIWTRGANTGAGTDDPTWVGPDLRLPPTRF